MTTATICHCLAHRGDPHVHLDDTSTRATDLPKRRHELTLTIGADSFDDLVLALQQVERELDDTGNNTTTGGVSWGGHWEHVVRPEQTAERYRAEVLAWVEARKAVSP